MMSEIMPKKHSSSAPLVLVAALVAVVVIAGFSLKASGSTLGLAPSNTMMPVVMTKSGLVTSITVDSTYFTVLNVSSSEWYILQGLTDPQSYLGESVTVTGTLIVVNLNGAPYHDGLNVTSITVLSNSLTPVTCSCPAFPSNCAVFTTGAGPCNCQSCVATTINPTTQTSTEPTTRHTIQLLPPPPNPILKAWNGFWNWLRCLFTYCST